MTDEDRNFDDRVRRLMHDAVSDAPNPPLPSQLTDVVTSTPTSGRGRWVTVGTLVAAVAVTVAGLVFVGRDSDNGVQPIETSATATISSPSTISAPGVSSPSVENTTTEAAEIARPVAAAEQCKSVAARDGYNRPLSFIGRASSNPVPLALFADPTTRINPVIVMVHRFFDDRSVRGDEFIDVDNTTYGITESADGDLEITWQLDDSLGHARARGLTSDELIDFVAALEPRPADAAITGFDYQPTSTPTRLQLIQELNDTDVEGTVARSVCLSDTGNRYRITALNGDPVFVSSAMLDRPAPIDMATVGDETIVINGPTGTDAPRASDVTNAGVSEWERLLAQPEDAVHQATQQGGAAGTDTTVDLASVDGTIEPSELTVRINTTDGITVLEVDKRGSSLHPDAAYWVIEVDGKIKGATSAYPGGVSGQTLGDLTGRIEPIIARISVIDGGDFVLQTTGNIELPPPT